MKRTLHCMVIVIVWIGMHPFLHAQTAGDAARLSPIELEAHWASRNLQPWRDWLSTLNSTRAQQPDALLVRARLARADGQVDQATDLVEQGLAITPDSSPLYSRLVFERATYKLDGLNDAGMFSSLRIARSVRDDFEQAHATDPNFVRAQLGLLQFHASAPAIAGGRDARAEAMRTLLQSTAPHQLTVFEAAQQLEQDQAQAALELIESLPADVTFDDPYWILIMSTVLQDQGRFELASQLIEESLVRFPRHAGLWYQRGRIAAESNQDPGRGLEAMLQYLELPHWPGDPELAAAWWRIGQLQLALGRDEGAREALEYALTRDPEFEPAKTLLEQLN